MGLNDIYEDMKSSYIEAIVLIKSGKFYLTYDNDATIVSYLFGYKKTKGKVGFPVDSLNKVLKKLEECSISYAIYDGTVIQYEKNNYYIFFEKANKDIIISGMIKDLTNKMRKAISSDTSNYQKIKGFIDEL